VKTGDRQTPTAVAGDLRGFARYADNPARGVMSVHLRGFAATVDNLRVA